jgi:hypothetical protein
MSCYSGPYESAISRLTALEERVAGLEDITETVGLLVVITGAIGGRGSRQSHRFKSWVPTSHVGFAVVLLRELAFDADELSGSCR